jgi:hypothetical protein
VLRHLRHSRARPLRPSSTCRTTDHTRVCYHHTRSTHDGRGFVVDAIDFGTVGEERGGGRGKLPRQLGLLGCYPHSTSTIPDQALAPNANIPATAGEEQGGGKEEGGGRSHLTSEVATHTSLPARQPATTPPSHTSRHRANASHLTCSHVLPLPSASNPAMVAMDPRMAALDLGLIHLEREAAQRERGTRRPPLIDLCSTAATSSGSGQDGDGSTRSSLPLDDLRR